MPEKAALLRTCTKNVQVRNRGAMHAGRAGNIRYVRRTILGQIYQSSMEARLNGSGRCGSLEKGGPAIATWLRASRIAALACLAALSACNQENLDHCSNRDGSLPPETVIAACTALIETGSFSGEQLATFHSNRGGAYNSQSDYAHARDDYADVIRLEPRNAQARSDRGLAYYNLGDRER